MEILFIVLRLPKIMPKIDISRSGALNGYPRAKSTVFMKRGSPLNRHLPSNSILNTIAILLYI